MSRLQVHYKYTVHIVHYYLYTGLFYLLPFMILLLRIVQIQADQHVQLSFHLLWNMQIVPLMAKEVFCSSKINNRVFALLRLCCSESLNPSSLWPRLYLSCIHFIFQSIPLWFQRGVRNTWGLRRGPFFKTLYLLMLNISPAAWICIQIAQLQTFKFHAVQTPTSSF